MSLLVVGSVALDTVETPEKRVDNVFGGSASYFSFAASFFTDVRLVSVVGDDFPPEFLETLKCRDIDLCGLEHVSGPTFRWHGKYQEDKNIRDTVSVELNCLCDYNPKVPDAFRSTPYVFLANANPRIQLEVLGQMKDPMLVVADTMNLWIDSEKDALIELIGKVGGFVLNDEELRMLSGKKNLVAGGKEVLKLGPEFLVVKKGEHGVLLFTKDKVIPIPAFPIECDLDPTGAGDSFGGAMMGYIAETGDTTEKGLKNALVYGAVTAAFTCEDFSLNRLESISRKDIDERFREYTTALDFG